MQHNEAVILLHGLARTARSMNKLARQFAQLGYHTINQNYPSRRFTVEQLAEQVISNALAQYPSVERIHFVAHSLGAILVRLYLSRHDIPVLGRVVMLGPPNHGSELVDKLCRFRLYRALLGPAAMQLGTNAQSLPNTIASPDCQVGIIAGNHSLNWLGNRLLPSPSDGTVSVASTRLDGIKNHLILPVSHSLMMNNREVIKQSVHFIQHGSFNFL